MNKTLWASIMTVLAITLISMSSVSAGVTRTTLSVELELAVGAPERAWTSGNMSHTRNVPYNSLGNITIDGIGYAVSGLANFNLDASGNGTDHGTVVLTAIDGSGGWEGHFSGTAGGGLLSNQFVAHGTGTQAGTMIKGSYIESAPLVGKFSGELMEVPGK